jgi:cytochrome P450
LALICKDIYQNPRITKSYAYAKSRVSPKATLFDTIDTELHRLKRKLIGQATTERSMRTFEPIMTEQINVFLRQLLVSSEKAEPVNITDRCQWLGLDVVGLLSFGYRLNLQTDESYRFIPKGMAFVNSRINLYLQFPEISPIEFILSRLNQKQRSKYIDVVKTMITKRVSQPKDAQHDLYSLVADGTITGSEGQPKIDLWSEALFFLTAGSFLETTKKMDFLRHN